MTLFNKIVSKHESITYMNEFPNKKQDLKNVLERENRVWMKQRIEFDF